MGARQLEQGRAVLIRMRRDNPRDICASQYQHYISKRDKHAAKTTDPEGREHKVDVCRLLCMSKMTVFALGAARMDEQDVVAARTCAHGELLTFYPGDLAVYAPSYDHRQHIAMRICSERVRNRLGNGTVEPGSALLDVGDGYSIYGHASFDDNTDYLGHLVSTAGTEANCKLQTLHGLTVAVVATRTIQAGEQLVRTK